MKNFCAHCKFYQPCADEMGNSEEAVVGTCLRYPPVLNTFLLERAFKGKFHRPEPEWEPNWWTQPVVREAATCGEYQPV